MRYKPCGRTAIQISGGKCSEGVRLTLGAVTRPKSLMTLVTGRAVYTFLAGDPQAPIERRPPAAAKQRALLGILDTLVRLSCGIDDGDDLISNLNKVLMA